MLFTMSIDKRNRNYTQLVAMLFEDDVLSCELFNWSNHNYSSTSTTISSVNIKENEANYEVEVAAPGWRKKI
jgi:HSP20 family protein